MNIIDGIINDIKKLKKRVDSLEVVGRPKTFSGSGSPEGALAAPIGSLYLRSDGGANTTLYIKESGAGNTGWIAK